MTWKTKPTCWAQDVPLPGQILHVPPGSARWQRLMSASKAAAAIGVSPYQSAWSCWHLLAGLASPADKPRDQFAFVRGTAMEAAVLEMIHADPAAWGLPADFWPSSLATQLQRVILTSEGEPWCVATIDTASMLEDGRLDTIVEIKTAASLDGWWDADGNFTVPPHYLAQAIVQLLAFPDAQRVHFAILGPRFEPRHAVIERADLGTTVEAMGARLYAFWLSAQEGIKPPALDDSVSTWDTVRAMHADITAGEVAVVPIKLWRDWRSAKAAEREYARRVRGLGADLLLRMGSAEFAVTSDGRDVARRRRGAHGVTLWDLTKEDQS